MGCNKQPTSSSTTVGVPNVTVNISNININTSYPALTSVGGWVFINGGYAGILLYRQSATAFLAFDRGCPYDCILSSSAVIQVQAGGTTATCPVCGSKFSITSGNVLDGPSTLSLKQYTTSFTNPYLTITN